MNRTLKMSSSSIRMMTMVKKSRFKIVEDEIEETMKCAPVSSIQRLRRILIMD